MHDRRTVTVLGCVLFATLLATGIRAQTIESPYRFVDTKQSGSLYASYLLTGKGSLDLGPEAGLRFGARYDINVSGPFNLEADVSYFSQTRAVFDTIPGDTSRMKIGDSDFSILVIGAGIRFNLTGARTYRRIQPYVLFGAGVALDLSNPSAEDEALANNIRFDFGTAFLGMFGGGTEIMLGERYSLRIDARSTLWKLQTPEAFQLKGDQALLLPADEWAQNLGLSAGLVFRF